MTTSEDFVRTALGRRGSHYIFAAEASPLDPDPSAFDCSELVEWAAARVHVSPTVPDGAYNQWKHCTPMSVAAAERTRGALMFHGDGTGVGRNAITHVAISLGDATTIEARGRAYGVGTWSAVARFQYAGLIPGIAYGARPSSTTKPAVNQGGGIAVGPGGASNVVRFVQQMLNVVRIHNGRSPIVADGVYGDRTKAAVAEFQVAWESVSGFHRLINLDIAHHGGLADPDTLRALSIVVRLIQG